MKKERLTFDSTILVCFVVLSLGMHSDLQYYMLKHLEYEACFLDTIYGYMDSFS